jgi:hypothetical protein
MRKSKQASERDLRNKQIRKSWETGLYTKAEISRQANLSLERVRQILNKAGALKEDEVALASDSFDWDTIKQIRGTMGIPMQKSTQLLIESQRGIYETPRKSLASVEYFVYVIEEVESRLRKLRELIDKLEVPEE